MALAPFFDRTALAAAQAVSGFDPDLFRERLEEVPVALIIGDDAADSPQGRLIADLTTRLLARLYPRLALQVPSGHAPLRDALAGIATSINPRIELVTEAGAAIVVGHAAAGEFHHGFTVFAGADAFEGLISTRSPRSVGASTNPFGAGVAACFACSLLYRHLITEESIDEEFSFSTVYADSQTQKDGGEGFALDHPLTLIGAGAIGNAAMWALVRGAVNGVVNVVDNECVEESNLQRYVLCGIGDVGRPKVKIVESTATLQVVGHQHPFESFASNNGGRVEHALVGVDSAETRRRVQASLPRVVDNAWTQPGDLGLSQHGQFGGKGACLYCLYLPTGRTPNEDELVAGSLGLSDQLMEVRRLLYTGEGVTGELLHRVAEALAIDRELLTPFEGRPLRSLYVEGLCGGAILPIESLGRPRQEMHVPLAHQSALAGVLLAAAAVQRNSGQSDKAGGTTTVTRIDVMRPIGSHLSQPAQANDDSGCICRDPDYQAAFASKWL